MSEVEQIKDKLDIVDVVGEYVDLKKAGINYQARCPFHSEKTPSFYVSSERGTYKCFGCGEGGDIYSFVQQMEGLSFRQTLEKLAKRAGVVLENKKSTEPKIATGEKETLMAAMEHATVFWQRQLGAQEAAKDYLKARGFTKEIVLKYRIGFAPDGWNELSDHLIQKGFTNEQIEKAGLSKKGDKGSHYDRFRSRIMFPLFDSTGRVIAVSGRIFGPDSEKKEVAKYMNSPETPIFNKSKVLYGFNFAKDAIRKNNFVLLVEGQVDLIMSQSVYPNTVASSGTSLTPDHLKLLKRFTDRLVFVYDSDNAGINAAYKGARLALAADFDVKIARMDEGSDPADMVAGGIDQYRDLISGARDVFDFFLEYIAKHFPQGRERSKKIEEKLLPLITSVANPLEQDRYVKKLATTLEISEALLLERLAQLKQKQPIIRQQRQENSEGEGSTMRDELLLDPHTKQIRHLAGMIAWHDSTISQKPFDKKEMITVLSPELVSEITDYIDAMDDAEKNTLIFELENTYKDTIINQNIILDLTQRLNTTQSQHKLQELRELLKEAELEGNKEKIEQYKKDIAALLTTTS